MSLTPGTRLGHYDVTTLIGEGGMGQVALKILPDAFAADPDRLARFEREASGHRFVAKGPPTESRRKGSR